MLYCLHSIMTSSSVKPVYFAKTFASSIVNSEKLFSADCVLIFLIGRIPVRYARWIYFEGSVPLKSPRKKLIYSSCIFWFAASSRSSTSHSSRIRINFFPVFALICDNASDDVPSDNSFSYVSRSSSITFLLIKVITWSAPPAGSIHHWMSIWIMSYWFRCFRKSAVFPTSSFSKISSVSRLLL